MPVLDLADDTALPARVDAFVFEQDTEYILRLDLPLRYPRESTEALVKAAVAAEGRVLGMCYAIEGEPLLLMAVVHDLARDPSWDEQAIAAAYAAVAYEVRERGLKDIVMPLLGTVHGRFDPVLSLAMLEAGLRVYGVDPRVWLRRAPAL